MESIGKFFVAIVMTFLGFLLTGFILMTIWSWFIVPTFQVNGLSFIQSIGLTVFLTYIKPRPKTSDDTSFTKIIEEWLTAVFYDLMIFGIAWVVTLFM